MVGLGYGAATGRADGDLVAGQFLLHLLGCGVGREVEVVDVGTHDGVAHGSAVDVGLVAQRIEGLHDVLVVVGILHDAGVEHRLGYDEFGIASADDFGIVGIDQRVDVAGEEAFSWFHNIWPS